MNFSIKTDLNPSNELIEQISDELDSYNLKFTSYLEGTNIVLSSTSDSGELLGGLFARKWRNRMEIRYLWIKEEIRGKQLGSVLVEQIELFAAKHAIRTIVVNTFSFQAPQFYLKNGYQIVNTLIDYYPEDIQRFYFKKTLSPRNEAL